MTNQTIRRRKYLETIKFLVANAREQTAQLSCGHIIKIAPHEIVGIGDEFCCLKCRDNDLHDVWKDAD